MTDTIAQEAMPEFRPFAINFASENDTITALCTTLTQKNDLSIDPGKNHDPCDDKPERVLSAPI
jgi:hypothetical protein